MRGRSRHWSVVEGGALVRSSASLSGLAATASSERSSKLLRRFHEVEPLFSPSEHPMMQLTNCARAIRQIVSERQFHLNERQVDAIVSIYERGLLAGYDGLVRPGRQGPSEGIASVELTDVSNSAWRHGNAVRERWHSYQKLVSVLFGSGQEC
ncbi:hypothetical protein [Rhizobium sp. CG5]|uniref:hypothetical protein n=1 Tax=Rhizobium sp. CG5 TaxID=2726076 RepID=UPI00203377D9|nr:hypothetical protein [Rhizobium sp. CG5]